MPAETSPAVVGERKNSTLWCACRATEHPCLVTKADAQTQKGSNLAQVNSRVKGNSNESQARVKGNSNESQVVMRLHTGGRYQRTVPLTKYAPKRARGTRRDKEETHSLKRHGRSKFRSHTSQTIPNSLCTGNIVPPGYKGKSRKAWRNSLVTNLLELSRRRDQCHQDCRRVNSQVTRRLQISYRIRSKVNWWDREEQ